MFGCFTFPKLGCKTKQNKNIFYFFTTQKLGAVAADLLHKSVLGLCLIISRAARYLPKLELNSIPSYKCILRSLWDQKIKSPNIKGLLMNVIFLILFLSFQYS